MKTSSDLKENLLSNSIAITGGYFSKKVLLTPIHNPFKRIVGKALKFVITNVVLSVLIF